VPSKTCLLFSLLQTKKYGKRAEEIDYLLAELDKVFVLKKMIKERQRRSIMVDSNGQLQNKH